MQQTLPSLGYLQPILNSNFRRKSDNLLVRAALNPPRTSATGGLEIQMRLLKTGPNSKLSPGDVIVGSKGRRYLLIGGGKDERNGEGGGVFKSVELDRITQLLRPVKTTDPITKRTNETLSVTGTIDYTEIPLRQLEDNLQIDSNQYEVLTDFPLRIGDKLREGIINTQVINRPISYQTAQSLAGYVYGYSESGYGQFSFGGDLGASVTFGEKIVVVHQVERRYGAYWARTKDV